MIPKFPNFCIIAPTSYLDDDIIKTNTHLVLAHLVATDAHYAEFYKRRSDNGDFIMMDNSAYELKEPYSPDRLIELATQCGAHAIVLPDYPFQPSSVTIEAAERFIPIFEEAGFLTFFVPQSTKGDFDGWVDSYIWAANNLQVDIIGMSILGIPNALPHIDPSYARVVMTAILKERGVFAEHKHHHYLGLNSGPGLEIPSLLKMDALDTLDSSGPVWAALLGHQYTTDADSLLLTKKPKLPVDFSQKRTKDAATLARVHHNIDLTLSLYTPSTEEVWYANE